MSVETTPRIATSAYGQRLQRRFAAEKEDDGNAKNVKASLTTSGTVRRYDVLTRLFHWIFAGVILYASVVGFSLAHISNRPLHDLLSRLNMSLATLLIPLLPLRVLWKFRRIEPPPPSGVPAAQLKLAHGVHGLMYLAMLLVLSSGFLMVPNGYSFFGLVTIPTPFTKGPLTDALFFVHRTGCALLAALVGLHVLAVLKHQMVNRNDILRRML